MKSLYPLSLSILVGLALISSCAINNTNNTLNDAVKKQKSPTSFFYIKNNAKEPQTYKNANWSVVANVVEKQDKPKKHYYDFIINASSQAFTLTDINYKYGNYGKWRIIEKKKYLNTSAVSSFSTAIRHFPISIKKIGTSHNQLLQLTVKTADNKVNYINLIFGIQKCIAKNEIEFVCF